MNGSPLDAVVLGAGASGLATASAVLRRGGGPLLVIDESPQLGGTDIDLRRGPFSFDLGRPLESSAPVLQHLPELRDRYVRAELRESRLTPEARVSAYPLSVRDDLLAAGPGELALTVLSAGRGRLRRGRVRHVRDLAERRIGPRLLRRSGLDADLERTFGLPADRIEPGATPLFRRARGARLVRPVQGYAHLYQPAADRLTSSGAEIWLDTRVCSVERTADGFRVRTDRGVVHAHQVISTLPVDLALPLCGLPVDRPWPSHRRILLGYSFTGDRGFAAGVLHNTSRRGAWTRLTVHSDVYGAVRGRGYAGVEVAAERVQQSVAAADADFREHVRAAGLFGGDLRLEVGQLLPHPRPVQADGWAARTRDGAERLREFGLGLMVTSSGLADPVHRPRAEAQLV